MPTATASGKAGAKKNSTGSQSKIALGAIIAVEAPPEPKTQGRKSLVRDVANQLSTPENRDKWFLVGQGKRTNAYQMRKRLKEILSGVEVEVRVQDADNADVYAKYTGDPEAGE